MDYQKRYGALNDAQKQAVDTVDGPVMVIAGPGTGKTELLSVRVANILRTSDTLPENILLLTFTESGAAAMRERLVGLLGKDAYKVAVHTFHSFGTEVINQNGEFFYAGAHFRPADDLSRYQIVRGIFESLGHSNILNKKMNGDFTYLSESLTVISELKKSGLTSDELLKVLDANDSVIEKTNQLLGPIFAGRIGKTTAEQAVAYAEAIRTSGATIALPGISALGDIIADSLIDAAEQASTVNSTKPITAWRNSWFKKSESGDFVLKSVERQKKLRAISSIYEQYLTRMSEAELYDFDDMILRVVHAMEVFDELRFNLQEKYQYIMVDEFQDTNMAQMRIVHNLTNNIAHGDTPNIMVVGDDDQAIYSFQGADISNIINFQTSYPKATVIALTDNYRSGQHILSSSRDIITQGTDRLEDRIAGLSKLLTARSHGGQGSVTLFEAGSTSEERQWLVDSIKTQIMAGAKPSDIAVLTRKHQEIEKLLPYFHHADIAASYERRDNVLDLAPIVLLEQLSRVLIGISIGQHGAVNGLLPQLLAHPAWNIAPETLWSLSLNAYNNHSHWIDEMGRFEELKGLKAWLIHTAYSIPTLPLETILDTLIGKSDSNASDDEHDDSDPVSEKSVTPFVSPLYDYFFSAGSLDESTEQYVQYLEGLRAIRSKLREYNPQETPSLLTFIEFISLHRSIGSGISSVRAASLTDDAVQLMTAHKSKGLEFDTVYIVGAVDSVWGERARNRSRMIGYPENLPLEPAGDSSDERLRLFYVATTRAKNVLNVSYGERDDSNKSQSRASFLVTDNLKPTIIQPSRSTANLQTSAEISWYDHLLPPSGSDLRSILAHTLDSYKLSVTHLTNFLDVTRGGPQNFLLQNLLRFPQAMSPASAYGSAIHAALQRAHMYISAHGQHQAVEDILTNFESSLADQHLSDADFELYLQKGSDNLQAFLSAKYDSFTAIQKVEINFASQHVMIGDAHISGALDLIDVGANKSVTVTDYKTGHALRSWNGKTDYEKIKLHKYKQQLMFYKLLVEHARDFRGHTVDAGVLQFIEPTASGDIINLHTDFSGEDLEQFTQLIGAVWQRIITLSLPDISQYDQSIKGILAFEQDLINNAV